MIKITEDYFREPVLTIKFEGAGNIKVGTLTNFLEQYQDLLLLINADLGYSTADLDIEISPPELSSFKINILPKYKDVVLQTMSGTVAAVLGGLIIYHVTKTQSPENAEKFITSNENGKIINRVYNSDHGKQIVNQTFITLSNDDNVAGFELDKDGRELLNVSKREIKKIAKENLGQDETKDELEEISDILTDKATLILKTVHFEGQAKWAFVFRGYHIKAQLADENFLRDLDLKTFKKGDVLTVLLSRKRIYDEALKTWIVDQNSYKIEKVINHHHSTENPTGDLGF